MNEIAEAGATINNHIKAVMPAWTMIAWLMVVVLLLLAVYLAVVTWQRIAIGSTVKRVAKQGKQQIERLKSRSAGCPQGVQVHWQD